MDHRVARAEVSKFIGEVMGIDTQRVLFVPDIRPDHLLEVEHWLVNQDKDYTVSYMAAHKRFLVVINMEGTGIPCLVTHKDLGIAFTTCFCITHGDTENGFERSLSIEHTILGDMLDGSRNHTEKEMRRMQEHKESE